MHWILIRPGLNIWLYFVKILFGCENITIYLVYTFSCLGDTFPQDKCKMAIWSSMQYNELVIMKNLSATIYMNRRWSALYVFRSIGFTMWTCEQSVRLDCWLYRCLQWDAHMSFSSWIYKPTNILTFACLNYLLIKFTIIFNQWCFSR